MPLASLCVFGRGVALLCAVLQCAIVTRVPMALEPEMGKGGPGWRESMMLLSWRPPHKPRGLSRLSPQVPMGDGALYTPPLRPSPGAEEQGSPRARTPGRAQ